MPRVAPSLAITTRDSIANLWAMAEANGAITLFPKSKREAYLIRNKLYAHRANERRYAEAHTGINSCTLDVFVPSIGPIIEYSGLVPQGTQESAWFIEISRRDMVSFMVGVSKHIGPIGPVDDLVYIVSSVKPKPIKK